MKLLIIGPQGSGKGTQAKLISEKYKIPHISTGDIFREAAQKGTEIGVRAKEQYWGKGNLVPDDVTIKIVYDRLQQKDCKKGFILDGFPRTMPQAEALDKITTIDNVIELELTDKEAVKRIVGRRNCKGCGEIFNIYSNKPKKENICDKCGNQLYQRDDDTEEKVKIRLETYHNQTKPIVEHYKGKVIKVDASEGIEEISKKIFSELD